MPRMTWTVPPSTLSLLGLVRHLTEAERGHFRSEFGGQHIEHPYSTDDRPDAAFTDATADDAERDIGHADLLRECIDGVTGD
jgi:Protein of unknown function (DUF664)